jgi:uncharacterized damage-inducible protein DinB
MTAMTASAAGRVDLIPIWARLNEDLVRLADCVPDDKLDWSPKPELWSFRRLFLHLAEAREEWMTRAINDGQPNIVAGQDPDKDQTRDLLRATWQRIERTLSDQSTLDAMYRDRWWAGAPERNGHWVAFHLLEHDIHHRADMFLYLALLGIETPKVWSE